MYYEAKNLLPSFCAFPRSLEQREILAANMLHPPGLRNPPLPAAGAGAGGRGGDLPQPQREGEQGIVGRAARLAVAMQAAARHGRALQQQQQQQQQQQGAAAGGGGGEGGGGGAEEGEVGELAEEQNEDGDGNAGGEMNVPCPMM